MKNLEYKILRYCPDRNVGEFANVGILVFDPLDQSIAFNIIKKYRRLSEFFKPNKIKYLMKILKILNYEIIGLGKDSIIETIEKDINSVACKIVRVDSSSLYFSDTYYYSTDNMEKCMEVLIKLYLEKYDSELIKSLTDEDVWKDYYKDLFQSTINAKLTEDIIKTKNDKFPFHYTHKNGLINIFEPLSFKIEPQSIKQKVYKWSGIIEELKTSRESYKLNFLSFIPDDLDDGLRKFIKTKLQISDDGQQTVLYDQDNIEKLKADLELEFNH